MTLLLNLGCGTRTSPHAVNIDWSIYLRASDSRVGRVLAPLVLRGYRLESFRSLDKNIVVHDLRRGIPAASCSVDAVYHSHVLEHIDREAVSGFLQEIFRVLRPGGVHRVVVPNFARQVGEYMKSLERNEPSHDEAVRALIGQSVRREASGTSRQPPVRRRIENFLLGDARKRGETHQWAWDQVNLRYVLEETGFAEFRLSEPTESRIPGWNLMGLDVEPDGTPYKPGSLWVETIRPTVS